MNKITKIGALLVALCILVVSLAANAATNGGDTRTVSLTLTPGDNSCVTDDFYLGSKTVSAVAVPTDTDTKSVSCTFLRNEVYNIVLALEPLVSSADNIAINNFSGSVANITTNGTLTAPSSSSVAEFSFASPKSVYIKTSNTAGVWSGNLSIWGTVPGGKPAGTYTGAIDVTLQAS